MGKLELNSSVQYIKGVGDKMAKYLNKLDICTIYDILTFYPREYEDRREKDSSSNWNCNIRSKGHKNQK